MSFSVSCWLSKRNGGLLNMCVLYYFLLALSFGFIAADQGLVQPCRTDDIKCLSKSTQHFLEQTHRGIPEHNIQAIDPLVIDSLQLDFKDESFVATLKNIQVTGLQNQKISDFRMDVKSQSVVLSTSADIELSADVTIEVPKQSKSYNGKWTAKSSILGKALYDYKLKADDKGVEHFEVGPEIIQAVIGDDAEGKLHFDTETKSDPAFIELAEKFKNNRKEVRTNTLKQIVEKSYAKVVANIRSAAKLLPKSAFFIDV